MPISKNASKNEKWSNEPRMLTSQQCDSSRPTSGLLAASHLQVLGAVLGRPVVVAEAEEVHRDAAQAASHSQVETAGWHRPTAVAKSSSAESARGIVFGQADSKRLF